MCRVTVHSWQVVNECQGSNQGHGTTNFKFFFCFFLFCFVFFLLIWVYSNKLKQLIDTYLMVNLFCTTHRPLIHGAYPSSSLDDSYAISITIEVSAIFSLSHRYTWVSEDWKLPP